MDVDYETYINSIAWKIKSRVFVGRRGYKCERCGVAEVEKQLFTHHKHYRTLGAEQDEDVEVLCFECHQKADSQRRGRKNAYKRGLDSWASDKYGSNWYERNDARERIEAEFKQWIFAGREREY